MGIPVGAFSIRFCNRLQSKNKTYPRTFVHITVFVSDIPTHHDVTTWIHVECQKGGVMYRIAEIEALIYGWYIHDKKRPKAFIHSLMRPV